MIPAIKKILYATDLSANSQYAFGYAVNSARNHNAEIVLIHAIEPIPESLEVYIELYLSEKGKARRASKKEEAREDVIKNIRQRLQSFVKKEFSDDPEESVPIFSIIVKEGYSVDIILKTADDLDCDLIVMGTHSKGLINQTLGSVTRRVLRKTTKPVYVIPVPKNIVPNKQF